MVTSRDMDAVVSQLKRINEGKYVSNVGLTISHPVENLFSDVEAVRRADAVFRRQMKVLREIWDKKKRELLR